MRLESEINKHIIHKLEQERDMYKRNWDRTLKERDTLIDDIVVLRANNERLRRENARLTRLTRKLTIHRTMWHALKDWRRDMLEIQPNDTQLIGLGLVMDDLEKRHLYKERADDER